MADSRPADAEGRPADVRRETRLLLTTIAVSVAVLLLLARFRFPEEAVRQGTEPAAAPLERLAARATYDELAGIMVDLERRIAPSILVVGGQKDGTTSYVPGVRILPDRVVAVIPHDRPIVPVNTAPAPKIVTRDAVRDLVVIQAASRPDAVVAMPAVAPKPGPRYLTVVEATAQGPAVRPVYVGRTELFADPRWPDSVLSVNAVQQTLPRGAAVFSLDGGFLGLVADSNGTVTVIPASTLLPVVKAMAAAPAGRGQLPIEVQALTPQLAKAAGASKGVMVSYVLPDTKADLASGDVIQTVDGVGVTTVAGFRHLEQSRAPGADVSITAIRRGRAVTATLRAFEAGAVNGMPPDVGAVLRTVPGAGAEIVTTHPGSAAVQAGLRPGDLVIAMGQTRAPAAAAIERAFRSTASGDALLLTVRRGTDHLVVALEKP